MRYELDSFHRDIPDEELLADLQRVAAELGKKYVSWRDYDSNGRFTAATLSRRLGGWNVACAKLGLDTQVKNISDDELLDDLRRIAAGNDSVTWREYDAKGRFSSVTFKERFGSWNAACARVEINAGLHRNLSNEELFRNVEEVWAQLGRQPRLAEMVKPLSICTGTVYMARFGGWRKALEAFIAYVGSEENTSLQESGEALAEDTIATSPEKAVAQEIIAKHKTTRIINWRLRFVVMRRNNFKCKCCGRSPATDPSIVLHVDHIVAWTNGGETVIENLQTLCSVCNIGKSDLEFTNASTTEVHNA